MDSNIIKIQSHEGSEWHKWDLHIHSPYVWLNNQYGHIDDEKFIDQIKNAGLEVVGLTNYFAFHEKELFTPDSLYNKLKESGIVVFPNLEFRLSTQNAKSDLCDYHVIFSPDLAIDKIELFLKNLTVKTKSGKKLASELTNNELRQPSLYVEMNDIFEAVEKVDILDHVFFGFLSRGKGESRSSIMSEDICNKSDFILHSGNSERTIVEDFKFWTNPNGDKRYVKPIFQSSDAHSIEQIGPKFTWIKGKPTINGLRQVKFNPADRIRFQIENPSYNKVPSSIIKKLKIIDKEIIFSDSLNSFIGKRGGGKSILLKAIALNASNTEYRKRFNEQEKIEKDILWIKKNFGDSYGVEWGDGTLGDQTDNERSILYLPQGYLSNISYDEYNMTEERNQFITGLLMKYPQFRKAQDYCNDFNSNIRTSIQEKIEKLLRLSEKNDELRKINQDIGDKGGIISAIKDLDNRISVLSENSCITVEENKAYQNSLLQLETIKTEIIAYNQDLDILNKVYQSGNTSLFRNDIFVGLSTKTKEKISKKILDNLNIQDTLKEEIDSLRQEVEKNTEKQEELNKTLNEIKPKYEAQNELRRLNEKKVELEKQKEQIEKNEDIITENKDSINSEVDKITKLYLQYETTIKDTYKTIQIDNLEFSNISFEADFSKDNYIKVIEQNINKNKINSLSDTSKKLVREEFNSVLDDDQLKNVIMDVLNDRFVYKVSSNSSAKYFLSTLLENPFHVDYLSSIKTKDNTTFDRMTGGQKAIVILELIFKLDTNNYPILIDQPEDDIDANGIATNVVEFLKRQKEQRQIFIASHNANLVVCSDSEEVIVAENNNGFQYMTGAIEDENIRKSIIDILEGGDDALNLRMNKLTFPLKGKK